jgi:hypothetical protein
MSDTPKAPSSQPVQHTEPQSTQYVAASVDDDRLEPDAMRGSEHLLHNVKGLDNLEAKRTEKLQAQAKKPE